MRKLLIIMLTGFILLSAFGNVAAQEDEECDEEDCDNCDTCRTNNFYYVLIVAMIIFSVFFYLRNKGKIG